MCHPLRAAIVEEEEEEEEEEGRREARRLCGLCLASAMDGALSAHRSRGQPWLPRLMMPVDRLAAHPSPLNDPHASFVLLLRAHPQARCDATQGRHPPRPNSVIAGWDSLIKCGDVVAGEEEKGPRKERKQDPGEEKIRRFRLLCLSAMC
ncbi:hypothetical protein CNYM01_03643 [Colletotrichum nymphaeae SA-01]|uniref:Uncharacterized protein n=1 Tax=Colletotrichum nymphaeae SA-01 TaxID=1460502 RepID=A0A135RWI7_9PEZI|nr:hypothetical protein CNYM01_03643 [Colletotrichum nymphaeae SA-01]